MKLRKGLGLGLLLLGALSQLGFSGLQQEVESNQLGFWLVLLLIVLVLVALLWWSLRGSWRSARDYPTSEEKAARAAVEAEHATTAAASVKARAAAEVDVAAEAEDAAESVSDKVEAAVEEAADTAADVVEGAVEAAEEAVEDVSAQVEAAEEAVEEKAEAAADKAAEVVEGAVETAEEAVEDVPEQVEAAAEAVEEKAEEVVEEAEDDETDAEDVAAARQEAAAGEPDNLRRIEGIGPKVNNALKDMGITTFAQLAEADPDKLEADLRAANVRILPGAPQTWPAQAALAAKGDWEGFEQYTDSLKGGREVD